MDSPVAAPEHALTQVLERQRESFRANPYPDLAERKRRLLQLRRLLSENEAEICARISQDFGCRPKEETQLLEFFPSLKTLDYSLRHLRRWMRPERGFAGIWFLPARTELLPQPVGVAGIIVPWNYPLFLAVGPAVDALAAGNHVLVKMSEFTPHFSQYFAQLAEKYFPDGELQVILGDAKVAAEFSALPFDHLLFTGSTAVGRKVMAAAAEHLTPVTLELGGKSPAIIAPDARFENAVERILYGKCVNAGQTCIAPDYILLPKTRIGDFIAHAKKHFATLYPDFPASGHYASIINEQQHQRLSGLLEEAVAAGATAHPLARTGDAGNRIFVPTLLTGVPEKTRVMQDEIFGPLLPLVPYASLDEALEYIAARPHPLSLYLFAEDRRVVRKVLQRSLAGGVSVNDTLYHIAQHHLPFGGIGPSGMGAYHGEAGFRTFSKLKPVFHQSRFNATGLLSPPYGARFRRMMRLLIGR